MNSEEVVLAHGLRLPEYSPNILVCEETSQIYGFVFEGTLLWKIAVDMPSKFDFELDSEGEETILNGEYRDFMCVTCTDTETMDFLVQDYYNEIESPIVNNWMHLIRENYKEENIDDAINSYMNSKYTKYTGNNLHTAVWWAIHMTNDYNGEWFNVGGVKCYRNEDGTFSYQDDTERMTSLIGKLLKA